MREIRPSGSEGGGAFRLSLPLGCSEDSLNAVKEFISILVPPANSLENRYYRKGHSSQQSRISGVKPNFRSPQIRPMHFTN